VDRPITDQQRRHTLIRRIAPLIGAAILIVVVVSIVSALVRPSVRRSRIRTAVADRGPIEATLTASGQVVPEQQQIITSPLDTRVVRVLKTPGDRVAAGESIVTLDLSEARLTIAKLEDQIALHRNQRRQAQLEHARALADLAGQREIKALELETCTYRAERNRKLVTKGICSEDEAREAETDAERARIELELIDQRVDNSRRSDANELEKLDIEIAILEKERDEAAHQLALASASASRAGVLTWVISSEGAAVHRGDEIARVSDLSAFRVDATVADAHAARLASGQPVIVRSGETRLRGEVANVLPTVEAGVITFQVRLDEPSHAVLRHNLRVDVYVVTDRKSEVVRIRRGAYVRADGSNAVFIMRGEVAIRTPVEFGITNFEQYEVVSGVAPGDEVIVSDMSDYMHMEEVKLR
jgi:HlyD family secretion protein